MNLKEAYDQGFKDGLEAYAINRDGKQWVGDPHKELRKAQEDIENTWGYSPPKEGE